MGGMFNFSNGNSFATQPSREPWYIRLLSAIQDREQT